MIKDNGWEWRSTPTLFSFYFPDLGMLFNELQWRDDHPAPRPPLRHSSPFNGPPPPTPPRCSIVKLDRTSPVWSGPSVWVPAALQWSWWRGARSQRRDFTWKTFSFGFISSRRRWFLILTVSASVWTFWVRFDGCYWLAFDFPADFYFIFSCWVGFVLLLFYFLLKSKGVIRDGWRGKG